MSVAGGGVMTHSGSSFYRHEGQASEGGRLDVSLPSGRRVIDQK